MTLYFAYGSNLDRDHFGSWCETNGFAPDQARALSPAWLPDHAFCFGKTSRTWGGGVADVRRSFGDSVPGALFDVSQEGLRALDHKEGVAAGIYRRVRRVCLRPDGSACEALTYVVCDQHAEAFVAPSDAYQQVVSNGLLAFGHKSHVPLTSRGEALFLPRAVFVYGTLMRGGRYAAHLPDADEVVAASVRGELVNTGPWPGMRVGDDDKAHEVHGELHRFRSRAALTSRLRDLDEIEDFVGYGKPGSLFRRSIMIARGEPAWVYVYLREGGAPIPSGRFS